jgi:hypothetical protein
MRILGGPDGVSEEHPVKKGSDAADNIPADNLIGIFII